MTLDAFLKLIKGILVVLIVPSSILRDPSRDIKIILVDWMDCLWIPKDSKFDSIIVFRGSLTAEVRGGSVNEHAFPEKEGGHNRIPKG